MPTANSGLILTGEDTGCASALQDHALAASPMFIDQSPLAASLIVLVFMRVNEHSQHSHCHQPILMGIRYMHQH